MKRILSLLFALLLLAGCTGQQTPEPVVEMTAVPEIEDAITLVTPVPTDTPGATPEPTAAPTPEPTPEPTATPTPAPFLASALPGTLRVRRGFSATEHEGVLRREKDGAYFAYGTVGETDPCFYPCDDAGTVVPGTLPAETVCAVPTYTPTDKPHQDGLLKLVVYIPTQSVVAFRAEDGEWLEERVMICSTGRPGAGTPLGNFRVYETHAFKRLGGEGNYSCGLYACRFNGAILFHSIPVSYDAINDPELGHRMIYMHKYEQLGTNVSEGCVRLTVADAKWIYDNSAEPYQTAVLITDEEGPVPPAAPAVIWEEPYTDENGFGWDPTDPHPDNPYLHRDPSLPAPTATPAPFVASMLPDTVRVRNGCTGSSFTGVVRRNSDGAYFAYGSTGTTEPCFYPCDEDGVVAQGAAPVPNEFTVPAYTPTDPPKADGEKLLVVYTGSQSVVGYVGKDGDWEEQRIMICSSGRKNHDTPTGTTKITDRYTYKKLGTTEDSHCYGFYASRFRTHHLFHSVPISEKATKADEGHYMCNMHKYEKLGTVASDGCVRMTVADAKWVYEFSETGKVTVCVTRDKGPTPEKPPAIIWEEPYTDKNGYGWDPTDPDPRNPYLLLNAATAEEP